MSKHKSGPASDAIGGGANDLVVKEVATEAVNTVPPADADEWLAGTAVVLDFIRDWLRSHPTNRSAAPAVFVFPQYPSRVQQTLGGQKVHGFKWAHQTQAIQGNVYISADTLTDVAEIQGAAADVPGAFQFLIDHRLGDVPAVVALPGTEEAILCPVGVATEDACKKLSLKPETRGVTVATIDEKLEQFYQAWLIVPVEYTNVWADKDRFIPARNTEKAIHNYLFPFLKTAFDESHIVRTEDRTPSGRADITILRREDRVSEGSGVVELKVLRAMRYPESGGTAVVCPATVNEDAITDGITQALSYRRKLGCELAFLCMYDLRRADDSSIVEQFRQHFTNSNVEARRYFLYNSSRAYRRAQPESVPRRRRSTQGAAGTASPSRITRGKPAARVAEPAPKGPKKRRSRPGSGRKKH